MTGFSVHHGRNAQLAVLVQSSSAAGKTSLMAAVLAMLPEEERIKYSAVTSQSLFYLGEADLIFFQTPKLLMLAFGVLAVLSFIYAPDFLAVRGLTILMLLVAEPLLYAAYMEWTHPQRLLMVTAVYIGLTAAIYLAAYPFRLRDFFEWLFRTPGRPRLVGAIVLAYGLATSAAAFTY